MHLEDLGRLRTENALSQFNLGLTYRNGHGVPQDPVEAYKWLNLASVRSSGTSQNRYVTVRDQLAKQITPAQAEEAQKRSQEWMQIFDSAKR